MNHYDQYDFVSGKFEWKTIEEKTADRGEDKEIIARYKSLKNKVTTRWEGPQSLSYY